MLTITTIRSLRQFSLNRIRLISSSPLLNNDLEKKTKPLHYNIHKNTYEDHLKDIFRLPDRLFNDYGKYKPVVHPLFTWDSYSTLVLSGSIDRLDVENFNNFLYLKKKEIKSDKIAIVERYLNLKERMINNMYIHSIYSIEALSILIIGNFMIFEPFGYTFQIITNALMIGYYMNKFNPESKKNEDLYTLNIIKNTWEKFLKNNNIEKNQYIIESIQKIKNSIEKYDIETFNSEIKKANLSEEEHMLIANKFNQELNLLKNYQESKLLPDLFIFWGLTTSSLSTIYDICYQVSIFPIIPWMIYSWFIFFIYKQFYPITHHEYNIKMKILENMRRKIDMKFQEIQRK